MKERPILFSGPMVRAILDGRKTQTRRAMKDQPGEITPAGRPLFFANGEAGRRVHPKCPYGKIGDRLWVRETFFEGIQYLTDQCGERYTQRTGEILGYAADGFAPGATACEKRPSIFMPRRASRITLEITDIRVERLNEISEADAVAEGIERVVDNSPFCGPDCWRDYSADGLIPFDGDKPIASFRSLWESINGAGSWAANPWVWVIEFKRVAP